MNDGAHLGFFLETMKGEGPLRSAQLSQANEESSTPSAFKEISESADGVPMTASLHSSELSEVSGQRGTFDRVEGEPPWGPGCWEPVFAHPALSCFLSASSCWETMTRSRPCLRARTVSASAW